MAAIIFATGDESPNSMTLTFQRNPEYPRSHPGVAPAHVQYFAADGAPYLAEFGLSAEVELTWSPNGPMHGDDYAALQVFVRYVRATQDQWTYTDDAGVEHLAYFTETPDGFAHLPHGFAGTLRMKVMS